MTVLVMGNAEGDIVPPMAVVSFKKIPTDIATAANPEWAVARTPNGWMTYSSFFEYIANVFEPYLLKQNIPKPVILFFDGHSSHLSLQLSQFCLDKEIILVTLPPNATHLLQPLDVAVFGPLKKDWKVVLDKFKLTKKIEPKKCHVLPILEGIFNDSNFKQNFAKGFKTCGLCPLDPNQVDYTRCLNYVEKSPEQSLNETPVDVDMVLKQFEHKIPRSLLNDFEKIGQHSRWSGDEKLIGLFNFYKAIKFDLNFEDVMNAESESTYDILDQGFELPPNYSEGRCPLFEIYLHCRQTYQN